MNKKIILIEDDKDLQEIIKYNFSKEKIGTKLLNKEKGKKNKNVNIKKKGLLA